MAAFSGFPDGPLRATALPTLFFSEVLREIDDPIELKVTLYLFWRFAEVKRYPRYLTGRELAGDSTIRRGLARLGPEALSRGLAATVAHGVILHRSMELRGQDEDCYFLNTAAGRRWVRDLEAGKLDLGQVVRPPEPNEREPRPNVFRLYEENVGMLTPLIVEELKDAERRYPGEWIEDAFREAVAYNRRSWKYVERILQRWADQGKGDAAPGRGAEPPGLAPADRRGR